MRTLVTKRPLPLLLLLLLLPPPVQLQRNFRDRYPEDPEFADYLEEIYGTGPTKPPTKKKVLEKIIADVERLEGRNNDCRAEVMDTNVHYKLNCVPEHYFLKVSYEELQDICNNPVVPCKNGIERCKKGKKVIEGVYCKLIEGTRMPDCYFESSVRTGYALITCYWKNDTQEYIPHSVNDLVPPD